MGALCCKPEQIDFDAPVDLWHFYLLRSVGKGAFGKVRVVQHKQTKALYALKYINKQRCIKQHAVQNIIQERRLLEEIECPFVCNLRYAFQDDENLFMVLDLMLGGDLRFHLDRMGFIQEDAVRFVMAELAIALDYLHNKGIVHRDVKPDNILLDEKGHAHLTDFNIAVHYTERRALTSVAGSMAYMAPEVLLKRGYTYTVDWWSLGVTGWELLFGKRPFRGKTNSALTQCILRDSLKLPENKPQQVSEECMDFLTRLLERDINKRIGCKGSGGLEALKQHPWMRGLDWSALEAKRLAPPFQPDSKKANFDATHELEELLLEDNPLKAKKRNPKNDVNTMTAEMRLMEESFFIYDHTAMARKSWFPDPHAQTQSSMSITGTTKVLSVEDQPLASRVTTPVVGETSSYVGTQSGHRTASASQLHESSPRKALSQSHSHSQQGSLKENTVPIELKDMSSPSSPQDAHIQDSHQSSRVATNNTPPPTLPRNASAGSTHSSRPLRSTSPYLRSHYNHSNTSTNEALPALPRTSTSSATNPYQSNNLTRQDEEEVIHINQSTKAKVGSPMAH